MGLFQGVDRLKPNCGCGRGRVPGPLFAVFAMLAVGIAWPDAVSAQQAPDTSDAQFTAGGSERCLECHAAESMQIISETVHGNADNPHTPASKQGCETCHGPGSLHVSRARGGVGFPDLLAFRGTEFLDRQIAACQQCHAEDMGELEGMAWEGSLHAAEELTCGDCHEMHSTENPMADRAGEVASCADCHRPDIRRHPRFEDVGIVWETLKCSKCHDVHQLLAADEQPEP